MTSLARYFGSTVVFLVLTLPPHLSLLIPSLRSLPLPENQITWFLEITSSSLKLFQHYLQLHLPLVFQEVAPISKNRSQKDSTLHQHFRNPVPGLSSYGERSTAHSATTCVCEMDGSIDRALSALIGRFRQIPSGHICLAFFELLLLRGISTDQK